MKEISKFEILTKYISKFKEDKVGDIHGFVEANEDMDLYSYVDILKENKIKLGNDCKNDDLSSLNERCVMAHIVAVVRQERFGNGIIMEFIENGCITKWLNRLKEFYDE